MRKSIISICLIICILYGITKNVYALDGWIEENGETYYLINDIKVTGPKTIDKNKYLFNEEGIMQTGFVRDEETKKIYFYSRVNGALKTGWQNASEGKWYQSSEGEVLTGKQTINNNKYYFNDEGIMQTGFIRDNETKKIYFYSRVNGALKTGWQNASEGKWYQNSEGEVLTGSQTIDKNKYYFNEEGIMQTGFLRDEETNRMYFYSRVNGALKTGWQNASEGIWYQNAEGIVNEENGLLIIGEKEYFFKNGFAQTGIVKIDDKEYYFNKNTYNKEYGIYNEKYRKYYLNEETGELQRVQTVPKYFSQKDSRWADIRIGNARFGSTGCVPTSLAMAFTSIKQKEILPIDIGYYLYNNTDQFNKNYKGASGKAIIYASQHYGITYKNIYTKEQLIEELEKGNIIYASMQNGKFATPYWNHAILIYDYSNDKVRTIASDPLNSNNNGWVDIDLIWNQKNTDPDDLTGGSALYSLS